MLECFLDEHIQQATGLYLVGVLAVEDSSYQEFVGEMHVIRESARRVTGDPNAEIHGHEIFHGTKGTSYAGVSICDRIKIFKDVITLVARKGKRMCIKPIDTRHQKYRASGPAHIWALQWACEHIEIISDSSGWRLTADDHPQYNRIVQSALDRARLLSTRNCKPFRSLSADSPIFKHSHDSLGVQACDTALYCVGRHKFNTAQGLSGQSPKEINKFVNILASGGVLLEKNTWP
jgi:hypothetical protein